MTAQGNSSATFAASSNSVLVNFETTTNEQVFGNVNQALGSVNTTINAFYDGLERTITDTFGQTPLGTAAQGVAQCLIGNKVDAISRAITFVHKCVKLFLPGLRAQADQRTANLASTYRGCPRTSCYSMNLRLSLPPSHQAMKVHRTSSTACSTATSPAWRRNAYSI